MQMMEEICQGLNLPESETIKLDASNLETYSFTPWQEGLEGVCSESLMNVIAHSLVLKRITTKMKKSKLKTKTVLGILLLFAIIFSPLFTHSNIHAEGSAKDQPYLLSFDVFRPSFSDIEGNLFAVYSNYWMGQPTNAVFDRDKWGLNSFDMEYELHIERRNGEKSSVSKKMFYDSSDYSWQETLSFENIKIPYDHIELQYYTKDDQTLFEPYLLHYDLYLIEAENHMILKMPDIQPKSTPNEMQLASSSNVIRINNLNITETNPPIRTIFLNGLSGSDDNDGISPETAFMTFKKAKEAAIQNQEITQIIVTGTTPIEGDISLAGTHAKLVRADDFTGYILSVPSNKTASLADITIDGARTGKTEKSLIEVNSNATLNIQAGTVLQNNIIKDKESKSATQGGAIYASGATINMTGGKIQNNQANYGGGVYLDKSTMTFSGGVVQDNEAKTVSDTTVTPTQYYAAGGGILATNSSTLNLSDNAQVLNNHSGEVGGGISLGSNQLSHTSVLNMTGGLIDGNVAGSSGGGIFVQAQYYNHGPSKAYISSGRITNNQMDGSGLTNKMFGGGGIYVNGATAEPYNGANGELYLTNAIITDNTAANEGAGYAACPISKTIIKINNGCAIYGNHSEKSKDLYVLCRNDLGLHSGEPDYELSNRMLGGVPYNWKKDNNSLLPLSKYKGTLREHKDFLGLHTDEVGNTLTTDLAKVIISGNTSATRGGGIGSNGTITMGTDEPTTKVLVEKKWEDGKNIYKKRPASVTVHLIATVGGDSENSYVVETRALNEDNHWKTEFKDLPTKSGYSEVSYSIKEDSVASYTSKLTGNQQDGFTLTNTIDIPTIDIPVTKDWKDSEGKTLNKLPVDKIDVELFKDGQATGQILELNEENQWTGVFEKLAMSEALGKKQYNYTIKEVGSDSSSIQLDGKWFKVSVTGTTETGFTITNQEKPPFIPLEPPTRNIKVTKEWQNFEGKALGQVPVDKIEVELYRDGVTTGIKKELNDKNNWTVSFEKLKVSEKIDSPLYTYTIKEVGEDKGSIRLDNKTFEVAYNGDMAEGFRILNKETPPPPVVQTGESADFLLHASYFLSSALIFTAWSASKKRKKD